MDEQTRITLIPKAAFAYLEIFYQGQGFKLTEEKLPFLLGRDAASCQLVIDHQKASRQHCSLVVEDGQIGLRDESSNGTSVQVGRGGSIIVKDKFYPLSGQGCIQLGRTIIPDAPDLIHFKMVYKTAK